VDLSAFYADVSKDRLYTFGAASPERRSAQTAMYVIADGLARLLAPIVPVTADELWRHLPGERDGSVHIAEFPDDLASLRDDALVERWTRLIAIRDDVNRALEGARQAKEIGTSLGARVSLEAGREDAALLEAYEQDLAMLFIVSQVELTRTAGNGVTVSVSRAGGDKCPRCWRFVDALSPEGICDRCARALGREPIVA